MSLRKKPPNQLAKKTTDIEKPNITYIEDDTGTPKTQASKAYVQTSVRVTRRQRIFNIITFRRIRTEEAEEYEIQTLWVVLASAFIVAIIAFVVGMVTPRTEAAGYIILGSLLFMAAIFQRLIELIVDEFMHKKPVRRKIYNGSLWVMFPYILILIVLAQGYVELLDNKKTTGLEIIGVQQILNYILSLNKYLAHIAYLGYIILTHIVLVFIAYVVGHYIETRKQKVTIIQNSVTVERHQTVTNKPPIIVKKEKRKSKRGGVWLIIVMLLIALYFLLR